MDYLVYVIPAAIVLFFVWAYLNRDTSAMAAKFGKPIARLLKR
ncbi:MAG: hypothetical protein WAX89_01050 [Alphaproteobacteria bacterium]